jgi:ion channel-forming bestrophin family protein
MLLDKKIPLTYIFNKIKFDIVVVFAIGILLISLTYRFHLPEIPLTIPMFLGTAISILLSFKLNQSYDRWWEARKVWGSIVNDSRTLALQLEGFVKDNEPVIKKMVYRQIAWCYSLAASLRRSDSLANLNQFISREELENISPHSNRPLALLQLHIRDLKTLKDLSQLDVFAHVQLDNTLVRLCDAQGKAERIKSTVFPVTYRKFLHYIIYIFVVTLSVALNNLAFYYELPVLLLISSAFFLLEKSATHMQDPFEDRPTDTAMTAISQTIEINLKQLLNEKDIPKVKEPDEFYLK